MDYIYFDSKKLSKEEIIGEHGTVLNPINSEKEAVAMAKKLEKDMKKRIMKGKFVAVFLGSDGKYRGYLNEDEEPQIKDEPSYEEYSPNDVEQKIERDGLRAYFLNGPTWKNDKKALSQMSLQELARHAGFKLEWISDLTVDNERDLNTIEGFLLGYYNEKTTNSTTE